MEPRREEPKAAKPPSEQKPKRFRIVKLEERIAPSKGGGKTDNGNSCHTTCTCGCITVGCSGLSIE
jgi:hypothetical protein